MPTTYELKFKDGGVWMDTNNFLALVKELQELQARFGVDADTSFVVGGIELTLKKSD